MAGLPDDFSLPERVDLPTGHHLRPIRADDVDIDFPAVMGSRERLWAKYGEAWGWPPADMSLEADREDLAHHEAEIAALETFNYALLDADETELLGCVYVDPPARAHRPAPTPSHRGGSSTMRPEPSSNGCSMSSCPAGWPAHGGSPRSTTSPDGAAGAPLPC